MSNSSLSITEQREYDDLSRQPDFYRSYKLNFNDNFILTVDDFLTLKECQEVIDIFHFYEGNGLVHSRQDGEGIPTELKKDDSTQLFFQENYRDAYTKYIDLYRESNNELKNIIARMWNVYDEYESKYMLGMASQTPLTNHSFKIQRTEPGGGYHMWHSERSGGPYLGRYVVWAIFLNDVEEGGETEFIHQNFRAKPKAGSLIMWPAGFTHIHRGNPPLSGTKYLATGWISI